MKNLIEIRGKNRVGNKTTKIMRPVTGDYIFRDVETGKTWVLGDDSSLFSYRDGRCHTLRTNCTIHK